MVLALDLDERCHVHRPLLQLGSHDVAEARDRSDLGRSEISNSAPSVSSVKPLPLQR
jgi:hypothetical protein